MDRKISPPRFLLHFEDDRLPKIQLAFRKPGYFSGEPKLRIVIKI